MTNQLPAETKTILDSQKGEADGLIRSLEGYEIQSPEQFRQLSALLVTAKDRLRHIDNTQSLVTKPLQEALHNFRELFRPYVETYEGVEKRLKEIINAYQVKKEELRKAWQNALATARDDTAKAQALEALRQLDAAPAEGAAEGATVGITRRWDFVVTDPGLIPDAYWCLDTGAVKAAISAGVTDIPGLNIFQRVDTTVRKRRGAAK